MLHKLAEEWHDTLLYIGAVFGMLAFFLGYWKGEYQSRYAELVMREFLYEVTVNGSVTQEEYEALLMRLQKINPEYVPEISCIVYDEEPVYALIPEEEIASYYMKRNVKKETEFKPYEWVLSEEKPELLCMQKESNAELLASGKAMLPLPEEEIWNIKALKPVQQIYEDENLVTMCHIQSEDGEFYAEAEHMTCRTSGIAYLKLCLQNKEYQIPVQVYCYPRVVTCENGHEVVNSADILSEDNEISKLLCPYCKVIPESISCKTGFLRKSTGIELSGKELEIMVTYLNGATEIISPGSLEWQDSFDVNYCGVQNVIINYRGKETTLSVYTENMGCRQCNGACNERNFQDYMSFPYCIKCMSQMELFTGTFYTERRIISESELISALEKSNLRDFKIGDFIRLTLTLKGKPVIFLQEMIKQNGKTEDGR